MKKLTVPSVWFATSRRPVASEFALRRAAIQPGPTYSSTPSPMLSLLSVKTRVDTWLPNTFSRRSVISRTSADAKQACGKNRASLHRN